MKKLKPAVLITGAGSGIGKATAELFSQHGHDVILVGRRVQLLEEVASQIKTESFVFPCDITKSDDVEKLVHKANQLVSHMGILVNNAAVYERRPFIESDDKFWEAHFATNLFALVRLCRGFAPMFQEAGGGAILNVASTAGLRPVAGLSAYATSKAAVISLTQTLALELASDNIRVNAVCPGLVETPILGIEKHDAKEQEKLRKIYSQMHPLGRLGQPLDVAGMIYHLCSDQSKWITGAVVPVDGGISLT